MISRLEKARAHAANVLDAYRRLRATYAILDPLLFGNAARPMRGPAAQGRAILVNTLVYACVLEAVKLTLDTDKRSPSLMKLDETLTNDELLTALHKDFAVWNAAFVHEDPAVVALVEVSERSDENKRRVAFDALVLRFRAEWRELQESAVLRSFNTLRDKVIAHNELGLSNGRYNDFDVSSLGLKFTDLRDLVFALEAMVTQINLIFRAADFDFVESAKQWGAAGEKFWELSLGQSLSEA